MVKEGDWRSGVVGGWFGEGVGSWKTKSCLEKEGVGWIEKKGHAGCLRGEQQSYGRQE